MEKNKFKLEFQVKDKDELEKLTHEELLKYVKELTDSLVPEKPKKDSNNSSIAPSQDINKPKPNKSLREISGKSSGGQKGHIGSTLKQSDTPDIIIEMGKDRKECLKCGSSLSNVLAKLKEKRQILDINLEDLNTKITEYQSYSKNCPICGYENIEEFPNNIAPHISYGVNIQSLVTYLNIVHYLPYNRIVEVLSSLYKIDISEGSISNMLKRMNELSEKEILKIQENLELSRVVGIDETGCKIDGEKHWNWVFQDRKNTLIVINKSRGAKVISETFPNGFNENVCIVHDNYSSYSSLNVDREQLCLAHKLRDLNYAIECEDNETMKSIKFILKEAIKDDKEDLVYNQRLILREFYKVMLESLLKEKIPEDDIESLRQIKSFAKAKDKIFEFLTHSDIPADNNGSERAIRNIKVKLKVSGQFKSFKGAENYANLRSIIDTSKKRNMNPLEVLSKISNNMVIF